VNTNKVWTLYPRLTAAVKKTHDENGKVFYAHDFEHAVRVANYCHLIAQDEHSGRLAAVAAMCHNADRILQKLHGLGTSGKVNDPEVISMVNDWLGAEPAETFSAEERELIIDAVLKHSQRNDPTDSIVLITVMDADRLANSDLDVLMRAGQYTPDVQCIDPVHFLNVPGESFRAPKSVLGNLIVSRQEWLDNEGPVPMRLPKAYTIMVRLLNDLKVYANMVWNQRELVGLVPYPLG
jgi:hypothetical protein